MRESPDLATKALLLHNSLVRKAMWQNYGTTIEQEGGGWARVEH